MKESYKIGQEDSEVSKLDIVSVYHAKVWDRNSEAKYLNIYYFFKEVKIMKRLLTFIVILGIILFRCSILSYAQNINNDNSGQIELTAEKREMIDKYLELELKKSKIPGLSLVIVNRDDTYYKSYGTKSINSFDPVDKKTLFEIGSNSKAFTAAGILYLQKKGKLSLDDPVSKYIPWFKMRVRDKDNRKIIKNVDITIEQLLHHTSGIPFNTIGDIPAGDSEDALEKSIKELLNIELESYPGEKYQYASINYDILGLVIQEISGTSFEEFIKQNILNPLELKNTFLFRHEAEATGNVAKGHKVGFFKIHEYNAPVYRANTPAGYFITNAEDMEKWLRIQLGMADIPEFYKDIIKESHIIDTKVMPHNSGYYYAAGWELDLKGKYILHGGNNPNYSSFSILKPEIGVGIFILANLNSEYTGVIAENIFNILENRKLIEKKNEFYLGFDTLFSCITIGSLILSILFLCLIISVLVETIQKKRLLIRPTAKRLAIMLLSLVVIFMYAFVLYYIPNIFFYRLPWEAVYVWSPPSVFPALIGLFVTGFLFWLYLMMVFNFKKEKEKAYIILIVLGIINGLTSSLLIFTINESFNRHLEYSKELMVYFVFSLIVFACSHIILNSMLTVYTNRIIYEKRMELANKIINASLQEIEDIGGARLYSGLNNDTSEVSRLPQIIAGIAINLLVLVFYASYLAYINLKLFLITIFITGLMAAIYSFIGRRTRKLWERNRDVQDTFFGQINDMIEGFKELAINCVKREQFMDDMKRYAQVYYETNSAASLSFIRVDTFRLVIFNIIFGFAVFGYPVLFNDANEYTVRENLLIIFSMVGPVNVLTGLIPMAVRLKVSWDRIKELSKEIDAKFDTEQPEICKMSYDGEICIELIDVEFSYRNNEGDSFTLGPINMSFKSGEIVFITGGNGSGKSTLAKVISGLYLPNSGLIKVNGKNVKSKELGEYYAAIFNDYRIFNKLYGINYNKKFKEILKLLKIMKIKDKVEIKDGNISAAKLSTGQRKRLALILRYVEDKPILLFDEWAAEQDPEFKKFFYKKILPYMKAKGKCVIAITHDDEYFEVADKVVKLERGKLVKSKEFIYKMTANI